MTKRRTKQDLADEAWLRAQQIDFSGALENEAPASPVVASSGIPQACPHCQKAMTFAHGWTASSDRLQCGTCGGFVEVPEIALVRFRKELKDFFAARAAKLAVQPKGRAAKRGAR